ncbi:hypothetical protein AAF712_008760 [Marasmius tenuissimus]|uniref:Glucose-methanol-choline oxidoreductase N-terminal domain-containing protein n=1 Tax=Marasmius tenuissimus TaxID=585030 RepID=A0ABR2ZTZ3_9AGAR
MRLLSVSPLISLALPGFSKLLHSLDELKSTSYDYVIVGAGTAGSVLASRLSEDGENRILVVEAGVDNADIQNIIVPFLAPRAINTVVDWNFTSTPQVGLLNRTIPLPRGHVLGGCSSINFMAWNRGSNDMWDGFARLSNDSSWAWNSVAKYYSKVSRLVPPVDGHNATGQVEPSVHGNGPVQTSLAEVQMVTDPLVVSAAKSLGGRFKFNEDMNAGDMTGFGYVQSTVGHGERSSAATAYLVPVLNRTNLDVLINTRVLKISSSKGGRVPTIDTLEVAQSAEGPRLNITAHKEIILSAGAFGTPQILLLSGIGPRVDLTKLHIPVLVDSPDVGNHLADQVLLSTYYVVNSSSTIDPVSRNATLQQELLQQWESSRTGLMSNPPGGSMMAFLKNPSDFLGGFDPSSGPGSGNTELIIYNGFAPGALPVLQDGSYLTAAMSVVSPTSRGTFTLNSNNPFDSPVINPQIFATQYDIKSMIQVMKDADTFVSQAAWDGFVVRPFIEFADDREREMYARNTSTSISHSVGTARMGPGGVEGGVVDSGLRVKGVKGLRIVDASIFVSHTSVDQPVS